MREISIGLWEPEYRQHAQVRALLSCCNAVKAILWNIMAVEPASSALVPSSSAAAEQLVPGRRATTATTVIQKASEKVVGCINLKAMEQSFPDFLESEDDRQFIQLLTDKTRQHLHAGFEVRP